MERNTFAGYERRDGVGTRNYVLVLPTVVCSSETTTAIARKIPGAVSVYNQHGCGQVGPDLEVVTSTLIGLGRNSNVTSVLVVALGCEAVPFQRVADQIADAGKTVELLVIQDEGGTPKTVKKGLEITRKLTRIARKEKRRKFPISELLVGIECGGSDWTSGVASNPAVGQAVDRVVEEGGRAVFSETAEIMGAEHLLAKRTTPKEAQNLLRMVRQVEDRARSMGVDLRGGQPSPGNMEGGITTIEEKSLGAIHKGGTSPIRGVLEYAAQIPRESGLYFMDTPGHDIESETGMVAGGAHLVVFTTGRGSPTGYPLAPVLKVTGNSETFVKMKDNMDINVGTIIDGEENLHEAGRRIYERIVSTASGKATKAELLGQREFGMYRLSSSF